MKQIIVFIAFMYFGTALSQVQKLGELSSGSLLDSAVIMEEDESDVFGYCLLYELDRKSKEVFDLQYVILDKNLNKITSVNLTQAVFKTWMAKTRAELTFVKKIGNQLTVAVNDRVIAMAEYDMVTFFNYRFININLENFTFSKEYKYEGFTQKEYDYKPGEKMEFNDFWDLQKLVKTKSNYFLTFASPEYNPKAAVTRSMIAFDFKRKQSIKRFALLDKDMKIAWSKDINSDKKTACRYEYLDSDSEILLLKKETLIKKEFLETKSIEVYDIKMGRLLGEIKIGDDKYDINLNDVSITKDKIHLFTNTYNEKGKSVGYGHLAFDKFSVKETGRKFILWKDLNTVITGVTEFGQSGKEYWLSAQDFILTPKGNLLVVIEEYNTKGARSVLTNTQRMYAQLKDMYLIEFGPDGNIAFSKKIEKNNSVEISPGTSALNMRRYGVFDYKFCQKINKAGDFVMYYALNDQDGNRKKLANKPLWTLGIISNVDGEYGYETLPLYGKDLKIYPSLAKNGYIRLLEVNQKTNEGEMRLEKINY